MVEQTLNKRYKPFLLALLGHINGQEYDSEYNFSQEGLISINTDDVARYMKFIAYGTEEPVPDDRSDGCQSSSL